jgi:hypothetical protein
VLVVCVLPILCLAALGGTGTRGNRIAVSAAVIAGSVAAKLALDLNAQTGGLVVVPTRELSLSYAYFPQLAANTSLVADSLFQIFGATIFGATVRDSLAELSRVPLLLIAMGAIVPPTLWICRRLLLPTWGLSAAPDAPPPLAAMLAIGAALNIAATIISRVIIDDYSTARYLFPTLVFGTILAARALSRMAWGRLLVPAAAALSLVAVVQTYRAGPRHMLPASPEVAELAGWLQAHKLTAGYGPYLAASIVTVMTGGEVAVRPVVRDGNGRPGIDMLRWLTSAAWYPVPFRSRKPEFVVLDRANEKTTFSMNDVVSTFGEPSGTASVQNYTVLIYRPVN